MTETKPQHAREFIQGSPFKTYDAILALVKCVEKDRKKKGTWKEGEPMVFTGSEIRLAAKNGTSHDTEARNIKKLVEEGWLIKVAGQRRNDGSFGTNHYRVVTAEEWLMTHVHVPKSRKKNNALRRTNVRRHLGRLGFVNAEPFVDAYLRGTEPQYTSRTVTQNTLPTVTQDTLSTVTRNTLTTVTQEPSTHRHASVREEVCIESLPEGSSLMEQACQPKSESAGQAGRCSLEGEPSSTKSNCNPKNFNPAGSRTREEQFNYERWVEFINWRGKFKFNKNDRTVYDSTPIPQEMLAAMPKTDEIPLLLTQIKRAGKIAFIQAVEDWVEIQSPPIGSLHYGRWTRWLETGNGFLEEQIDGKLCFILGEE